MAENSKMPQDNDINKIAKNYYLFNLRRLVYLSDKEFIGLDLEDQVAALSIIDEDGSPKGFEKWVKDIVPKEEEKVVNFKKEIKTDKTDDPLALGEGLLSGLVSKKESKV